MDLFERLRVPPAGLPIVLADGGGWILHETISGSWKHLENTLRKVLVAMYAATTRTGGELFPLPQQYGYDLVRCSRHAATNVAMRARNAFLPLMATISMMFAFLDHSYDPSWRNKIAETPGIHPQWIADLEDSAVGNMKTPRIGGIVDLSNQNDPVHTFDWLLPAILGKLPVPLYFHWGNITNKPTFPVPQPLKDRGLFPNADEITYLSGLPGKVAFSPWRQGSNGRMYSQRDSHPYVRRPAVTNPSTLSATETLSADETLLIRDEIMPCFPHPEKNSGTNSTAKIFTLLLLVGRLATSS
ncbi:hypothetical protein C8R44DRAFT_893809 [Mycena epipterygia]|nr:hypothetical protein C8R44DRAFT_893809 [Mycena epipterygia]